MTTLEEPTVKAPTVDPELRVEAREEEEVVVELAEPVGVVPVPLTTTEPSWMLVKVIRSTKVVFCPKPPRNLPGPAESVRR